MGYHGNKRQLVINLEMGLANKQLSVEEDPFQLLETEVPEAENEAVEGGPCYVTWDELLERLQLFTLREEEEPPEMMWQRLTDPEVKVITVPNQDNHDMSYYP